MNYPQIKKVWTMPLLLATLTLFGLLAALLGTGYSYLIAWAALLIPLALICGKLRKAAAK